MNSRQGPAGIRADAGGGCLRLLDGSVRRHQSRREPAINHRSLKDSTQNDLRRERGVLTRCPASGDAGPSEGPGSGF